jgi:hypothetical protein
LTESVVYLLAKTWCLKLLKPRNISDGQRNRKVPFVKKNKSHT